MFDFEKLAYLEVNKRLEFKRCGVDDVFEVISNEPQTSTMLLNESDRTLSVDMLSDISADIFAQFDRFVADDPRYLVGKAIDESLLDDNANSEEAMKERIKIYETLIVGCCLILYGHDKGASYAERCLQWLCTKTDFYYAAASTRYHEAYDGGLLKHTLRLVNNCLQLFKIDKFSRVNIAEAILCCLVHDWCKIGKYSKNVNWKKEVYYTYNESDIPFGHGVSSLFIAQKFFKLTREMALAIRWHMGRWNVSREEINDLQTANEKYPLVHMIQFADQLSITEY